MKKIALLVILSFGLFANQSMAQAYEVPANYAFKTKEDYTKYEPKIIETATWLESTPLKSDKAKRKNASAFLMTWLTGSPTVSVTVEDYVTKIAEGNPDLLMVFLAGWTKYKLQNMAITDKIKLNVAGLKSALKLYSLGGLNKNKTLDKLAKMDEDNLTKWITKQLKQ